ncbi:MAG: ABC transporter ATP-binding protein [Chlamydiae bacterium]|nr:ABC transporter ATP-binding protein [Chlamydiota bacterium]
MSSIKVENLGKRFRLKQDRGRSVKSSLLGLFRRSDLEKSLWALRNISFEVSPGETLGIIGANGAGKSTLLCLIAQTMRPTEGSVQISGRVSSLLELGAGFHPELTGRENIYLNGSILGLSKKQMDERYESIVDFAELKDFIHLPVKHYSSGMYVRLGFSVAVEVNPDVLLLDEILAVGDETFRKKCLKKISDFKRAGKAMLAVSHDLETVKTISDRVLLIDKGKQIQLGEPGKVVDDYLWLGLNRDKAPVVPKQWGTREVELGEIRFLDRAGQEQSEFKNGEDLRIEIAYEAHQKIERPVFGFSFSDEDGKICFGNNTQVQGLPIPFVEGKGSISLKIPKLPLIRGKYLFSFSVHTEDHAVNFHRKENTHVLRVRSQRNEVGFVEFPVVWSLGG